MDEQEFREDVLQRLAALEAAVHNHIPGQIKRVEETVHALDNKVWGVIVGLALSLFGMVFQILR